MTKMNGLSAIPRAHTISVNSERPSAETSALDATPADVLEPSAESEASMPPRLQDGLCNAQTHSLRSLYALVHQTRIPQADDHKFHAWLQLNHARDEVASLSTMEHHATQALEQPAQATQDKAPHAPSVIKVIHARSPVADTHGLNSDSKAILGHHFDLVDTRGDGSCGFYAFLAALMHHIKGKPAARPVATQQLRTMAQELPPGHEAACHGLQTLATQVEEHGESITQFAEEQGDVMAAASTALRVHRRASLESQSAGAGRHLEGSGFAGDEDLEALSGRFGLKSVVIGGSWRNLGDLGFNYDQPDHLHFLNHAATDDVLDTGIHFSALVPRQ